MAEKDELSTSDKCQEGHHGIILGIWDHEKTPIIIKDLERSVNSIEFKCKQLLKLLIYYRKYFNELNNPESEKYLNIFKNEQTKNLDSNNLVSGSDPDISFRKKLLKLKKLEETFEKNFEDELLAINTDLSKAAEKIGMKDNIVLFSTKEYIENLNKAAAASSWTDVRKKLFKSNTFKNSFKSTTSTPEMSTLNSEFSKITFSDLDLYRKLSKLSFKKMKFKQVKRFKVKKNVLSSRKKVDKISRFRVKKQIKGYNKKLNGKKSSRGKQKVSEKDKSSNNFFKKRKEYETKIEKKGKSRPKDLNFSTSVGSTSSGKTSQVFSSQSKTNVKSNEMEVNYICDLLAKTMDKQFPSQNSKIRAEATSNLSMFAKKKIPFIACSSTAKSYNIGTNIQQLLSKARYIADSKPKKKVNSSKVHSEQKSETVNLEPKSRNKIQDSENLSVENTLEPVQEFKATYPWSHNRSNSIKSQESNNSDHSEKFCTTQQSSKSISFRKHRSKYTRSWPEGFVEYHKSTMEQYINGQESVIKSESKRAYAIGSKIMVSDCQRTDFYQLDNQEDSYEKASGDGTCNSHDNKLKNEWLEVYKNFSNIYGKYNELKEQLENNNNMSSNQELSALSEEIDSAIEKYTDFLKVYSKFLHLKSRLKTLKTAVDSKTISPYSSSGPQCQKRFDSCKMTSSMTLKKVYRHLQVLQEKIKMVH